MESSATSGNFPHHVAIIMDGNGRWAKNRCRPRVLGHKAGRISVETVIKAAAMHGVKTLSLFAFSTENWLRPRAEVKTIMDIIEHHILQDAARLREQNIRMRVLGNRRGLPVNIQQQIEEAEVMTQHCTKMQVIFALNFSGQWEITETIKNLTDKVQRGKLSVDCIDNKTFEKARPMSDLPPVDLLIRSGGELRISNFFLWEIAYAELYFTDVLWPDFSIDDFNRALECYQRRQRRFGRVENDEDDAL